MKNAIIATIISLAKRLGIPALSKGVETPEQGKMLMELGCNYAQGFLYSKPVEIKVDVITIHH